eukprot:Skav218743  [mRNA]  locus=scaffold1346:959949:964090:+ [translate_table: standard]
MNRRSETQNVPMDQLSSLMDIVDLTEPHFIRSEPRHRTRHQGTRAQQGRTHRPDRYDRKGVTEQLRYGGVLQALWTRGWLTDSLAHELGRLQDHCISTDRLRLLGLKHVDDSKMRAQKLLEHLTAELHIPKPNHGQSLSRSSLPWAVGKTLEPTSGDLRHVTTWSAGGPRPSPLRFARLELLVKSATQIQTVWRRRVAMGKYKAPRHFHRLKQEGAAVKTQSLARQFLAPWCRENENSGHEK